jgi:hypothetical protein
LVLLALGVAELGTAWAIAVTVVIAIVIAGCARIGGFVSMSGTSGAT